MEYQFLWTPDLVIELLFLDLVSKNRGFHLTVNRHVMRIVCVRLTAVNESPRFTVRV